MFKVSISDPSTGKTHSHTLQANDEHDKRQWMNCIKGVLPDAQIKNNDACDNLSLASQSSPGSMSSFDCQSLDCQSIGSRSPGSSDGEEYIYNDENLEPVPE